MPLFFLKLVCLKLSMTRSIFPEANHVTLSSEPSFLYVPLWFDRKLFQIEILLSLSSHKIVARSWCWEGWQKLTVARAKTKMKETIIIIWCGEPVTSMIGHVVPRTLTLAPNDIRRRQLLWHHPRKWKLKNELVNKNRFLLLEVHKRLNQAMDDIRRLFDTVKGALKIMDDEYKVRMILLFEFLLNFMSY